MSKILKNTTLSNISISDTGITILASGFYNIPATDFPLWAASDDIVELVGSGSIVVNDGTSDLGPAQGIALIQGNFRQSDFIDSLKESDRLKVDAIISSNQFIKVSSNDQSQGYLEAKIVGKLGKTEVTVLNEGVNEQLQVDVSNDIFDKTQDTTTSIVEGTKLFFTDERAQDAVGSILEDSDSLALNYNDSSNIISGSVIPSGVNHDALQNFVGNEHIDHSLVSILNGYGIQGGGDLTASRTLSLDLTTVSDSDVSTTIQTTTTNPSYADTDIEVSLGAGKWLLMYSAVVSATSNNRLVKTALFLNGSIISNTSSQRRIGTGGGLLGGLLSTSVDQGPCVSSAVITLASPGTVDIRWNTSGGTATMQQRQITAVRIG